MVRHETRKPPQIDAMIDIESVSSIKYLVTIGKIKYYNFEMAKAREGIRIGKKSFCNFLAKKTLTVDFQKKNQLGRIPN